MTYFILDNSVLSVIFIISFNWVDVLTLSNMNISATSWQIGMKFYLKHHWGGGKASVGFDLDRISTLVSMATDSSHRVIMGKTASSRFLECF